MSRSQIQLVLALLGFASLVVAVWTLSVGRVQADQARQAEFARLLDHAGAVALLLDGVRLHPFERARVDAIADRAGAQLGLRVTVVGGDGSLLGDSEIGLGRLPSLDSFAGRPELVAALAGDPGTSRRRSESLGREFLYGAVPARGAAVRVGMPASVLGDYARSRRRAYLVAALVASVVAVGTAWLLSGIALRPIREMKRVAASVAQGRLDERLPFGAGTELADIANSINQIAAQDRARLADANQEKEQLQAVLESMVEGVLVLDSSGVVLVANPRVREFYAVRGELEGRPLLESIRDSELERVLVEAGGDEVISRRIVVGGRVPRTLQVQAARFPAHGERVGTVAVFHDVSELARLEEVRRDFVANASHELRTPLAAIRGFAETLLGGGGLSNDEQRGYVEIIERNAVRLGNIVSDLLELSDLESQGQPLESVAVDVTVIAQRLMREFDGRAREQRVALHLDAPESALALGDAAAIEQVLLNLVDNALKYTDEGGSVRVVVEPAPRALRVRVTDTGIGIAEPELPRIFERFYRVDRARSRALGGTGLGLAIVKHLVQSMGGEISVESGVGEGSSFGFWLPPGVAG